MRLILMQLCNVVVFVDLLSVFVKIILGELINLMCLLSLIFFKILVIFGVLFIVVAVRFRFNELMRFDLSMFGNLMILIVIVVLMFLLCVQFFNIFNIFFVFKEFVLLSVFLDDLKFAFFAFNFSFSLDVVYLNVIVGSFLWKYVNYVNIFFFGIKLILFSSKIMCLFGFIFCTNCSIFGDRYDNGFRAFKICMMIFESFIILINFL